MEWRCAGCSAERLARTVCQKDLLQIATEGGEGPAMFSVELRSDAKESMNETTFAGHITLRQPTDLPLPDQMHRFVTIDRP
jgi:hypothetical protein